VCPSSWGYVPPTSTLYAGKEIPGVSQPQPGHGEELLMKQESAVLIFRDPSTGTLRRLQLTPKMLAALIEASEEVDAPANRCKIRKGSETGDAPAEAPLLHLAD
jgi:hypothetical protein